MGVVAVMAYMVWSKDLLGMRAGDVEITDSQPAAVLEVPQEPAASPAVPVLEAPASAAPSEELEDESTPGPELKVEDPVVEDKRPVEMADAGAPVATEEKLRPVSGNEGPVTSPEIAQEESLLKPNKATLLEPARKTIRGFLEAKNWEGRLRFVHNGQGLRDQIQEYYASHVDLPFLDYRLDYFHTEPQPGGQRKVYVFFLTFSNQQDGFPVIVVEENNILGLDWDLFVEFKDRHFQQFIEERQKTPRSFRVVIQRVTYWESDRDQIPNVENLVCYKIDPPYPGFTQYAFVEKGTDAGERMTEQLSWQEDPLAAEVQLRWDEFDNGRAFLTVDRVASRSWVRN